MMDFLLSLDPPALYPALFVALVFLGGIVLLPAMYVTLTGALYLPYLFIVTMAAAIVSDSFWYAIGLSSKKERLYSFKFVKRRIEEAKRFSSFYQKHGARLVFFTKFVYGTRIASQVLAGMHRIGLPKFIAAVSLGSAIWFWVFYFLVRALNFGIDKTETTAFKVQLFFLLLISLMALLNWYTGTHLKRFFLKRKRGG